MSLLFAESAADATSSRVWTGNCDPEHETLCNVWDDENDENIVLPGGSTAVNSFAYG